ncbi:SDR family NAD(P)-dependent oxidoreductase [Novosphingobium tardum]|uniref:SDR family NAD(P)-dependent oxidoreductase n=1 Tax=Novosphingobium tardum TaxID=1538021 RepID=A0ABV8RP39_9SPHN
MIAAARTSAPVGPPGRLFVFGMGYTARTLAGQLRAGGWTIRGTGGSGDIAFDDEAEVCAALSDATHVLSSVPPDRAGSDPVLARYGDALAAARAQWAGYLSSTGVYGDTGGAWVDETAEIGRGRRTARAAADEAWQALRADMRVFRLPGIYGPGRSPLDRVRSGAAHRIDLPAQVFSRVHVEDIASAIAASFAGPAGVYNVADNLPASQNTVIEEACRLLQMPVPPLQSLDEAGLSPMARAFYAENRRVANGKARRLLGWRPRYPSFVEGLRALNASTSPPSASTAPVPARSDQR